MPESSRPLRILVYRDNPRTREQVQLALGKRVHPDLPELTYLEVATGPMVIAQMDEGGFDLAILDGEATPTGGMGIAKQLKDELDDCPPLLVLTGRAGELDRLRAFDRGADDYLPKPFSYHELHARMRALLRRSRRRPGTGKLRVGPLEIDPIARRVWLRGEPVELSKKEFALLRALAAEPTRVFTREELLRGVWGFRAMGHTRTLDSHAFRLRQKLNRSGERFVVNVWGVGYRLMDGGLGA